MPRVALYARYSDDKQSPASIDDQFLICREQAAREGWRIVANYKDAAISGASVILRPGIQSLLHDAQMGRFDILLAEALDRVSRDQADVATLYKNLQFAGVKIVTLAEGEVSELHVGLKGTMNALFLKDLAKKTHRGLRGRVEKGKSGGGLCFGYDVVRRFSSEGEPVHGERSINAAEAEVIRQVFRQFANGLSPHAIACRLNDSGISAPTGKLWTSTTIRGHVKRGTGLLNNELYIGKLVWNRLRYLKNPQTGKRVSRINSKSEWIVTEVPDLRIVDDELWQAVKARQENIAIQYADVIEATRSAHTALNRTHRPKSLLSGLVYCGGCGGPYSLRGQGRFTCSNHVDTKSCSNGHSITRDKLEARVLDGLRDRMMTPEVAAEAIRTYVEESNRINHQRRASEIVDRTELQKVLKAIKGLVTLAKAGKGTRALVDGLLELEAQEDAIRARLAAALADVPDIHPNISEIYRRKVERLTHALSQPEERQEAADALRALIERIELTPGAKRGEVNAMLYGEFGRILEWIEQRRLAENEQSPGALASGLCGMSVSVVAGERNHLNLHFHKHGSANEHGLATISKYLYSFDFDSSLYRAAA